MRNYYRVNVLVLVVGVSSVFMVGCHYSPSPRYTTAMMETPSLYRKPVAQFQSLFPEDQEAMSDEALTEVLNAAIELPEKMNLAVMQVEQNQHWYWTRLSANRQLIGDFLQALEQSVKLDRVFSVPAILNPQRMTIPNIRLTAARLQARLMLVYQYDTSYYTKKGLFKQETKAVCYLEAALIEVGSGVIIYTTAIEGQYPAVKTEEDFGVDEMIERAQREAVNLVLDKLADEIIDELQ